MDSAQYRFALCLTIVPLVMLLVFSFMNRNILPVSLGQVGHEQPYPYDRVQYVLAPVGQVPDDGAEGDAHMHCGGLSHGLAIAKIVKPKNRSIFMMVVILPFFTSQLLLIYAMMNLIQSGGLLLTFLDAIGFHNVPTMLYTNKATILILTYEYLPYMILCLYSSLEGIGDNLIQASLILGANKWKTFTNIVFPMSVPGLLSGVLLVFVPVAGSFMEPGLVGGANGAMVGSMIDTQYSGSLNMGYGAVLSCTLLIVLSIIMGLVRLATARAQKAIGGDVE